MTAKAPIIVNRRQAWHFDKKLSLDTLVAIAGIAVVLGGPAILAWRSMESRILVVETIQLVQQKQFEQLMVDEKDRRIFFAVQMKELTDTMTSMRLEVARMVAQQPQARMIAPGRN